MNRSPDIVVPIYGVQVVETNEGMITSGSFRYDVNYGVFSYNDQDLHTLWNHLRKQFNSCIDKSLKFSESDYSQRAMKYQYLKMMLNTDRRAMPKVPRLSSLTFFQCFYTIYVTKLGKNKTRHTLTIKTYLLEVLNINNGQLIAK